MYHRHLQTMDEVSCGCRVPLTCSICHRKPCSRQLNERFQQYLVHSSFFPRKQPQRSVVKEMTPCSKIMSHLTIQGQMLTSTALYSCPPNNGKSHFLTGYFTHFSTIFNRFASSSSLVGSRLTLSIYGITF